jgi:hypothetical protein
MQQFGGAGKSAFDYVTRRFSASSAGLKQSVGLDLRWDCRLARSRDPTEAPSQPKRVAEAGSRFRAELVCNSTPVKNPN